MKTYACLTKILNSKKQQIKHTTLREYILKRVLHQFFELPRLITYSKYPGFALPGPLLSFFKLSIAIEKMHNQLMPKSTFKVLRAYQWRDVTGDKT